MTTTATHEEVKAPVDYEHKSFWGKLWDNWLVKLVITIVVIAWLVPTVGLLINVIMMYFVFRDIFFRPTLTKNAKLLWTVSVLLFWPAILLYLPLHGFRARTI